MAYPASTGLLSKALDQLDGIMLMIKSLSTGLRTKSAAGTIPASDITDYMTRVADFRDRMAVLAVTPGLGAYAQAQKSLPGLDVTAEYNATLAQIDATRSWIITNFPKDGSNNLSIVKFDAAGRTVTNTFTTAALAGLRTQLAALEATIA
jgi:hypothetical protein